MLTSKCVSIFLVTLIAGCSAGTNEYVRIIPASGQPVLQLYIQAQSVITQWAEFSRSQSCSNEEEKLYSVAYKLRPELLSLYRGSRISIEVDSQLGLLVLIYTHEGSQSEMPPEQKKLFGDVLDRLKKEFSADRIVQMDFSGIASEDSKLLTKFSDRRIKSAPVCEL